MNIEIKDLTKTYSQGAQPALDNLSLQIGHGTFGLLGPNGAGKTTLIKILATQMVATDGKVTVDGRDIEADRNEFRKRLGYLPQHFGAYPQLTAWEFLDYRGRLGGLRSKRERLEKAKTALEDVGLYGSRDRRTGAFSGGMMRRLGIAQAILTDPDFLIVDEPTVGLDPEERIRFRTILGRLGKDRVILISTHIVGDISSTCEEIALLSQGKLLFQGPPVALIRMTEGKVWRLRADDRDFDEVSKQFQVVSVSTEGDWMDLRVVGDATPPPDAEALDPSLEDAYVYRIGAVTDVDTSRVGAASGRETI